METFNIVIPHIVSFNPLPSTIFVSLALIYFRLSLSWNMHAKSTWSTCEIEADKVHKTPHMPGDRYHCNIPNKESALVPIQRANRPKRISSGLSTKVVL